jgi:hypothetical protein
MNICFFTFEKAAVFADGMWIINNFSFKGENINE